MLLLGFRKKTLPKYGTLVCCLGARKGGLTQAEIFFKALPPTYRWMEGERPKINTQAAGCLPYLKCLGPKVCQISDVLNLGIFADV
jgi:hypothetical protein